MVPIYQNREALVGLTLYYRLPDSDKPIHGGPDRPLPVRPNHEMDWC
jgi:hypothetical protein